MDNLDKNEVTNECSARSRIKLNFNSLNEIEIHMKAIRQQLENQDDYIKVLEDDNNQLENELIRVNDRLKEESNKTKEKDDIIKILEDDNDQLENELIRANSKLKEESNKANNKLSEELSKERESYNKLKRESSKA